MLLLTMNNEKVSKGLDFIEESQREADKYVEYFEGWPKNKAKAAWRDLLYEMGRCTH